ncbi:DNA-binding response regulator [Virgibacillus profundi]|uniref:DNA-binding response regulator n=1 Tax=Virgibacillus profundi TaxID=2024555 RepID=A0A2A2I9Q7_9BACI|nr:response regulator transcription factor [Virgibacillus profundi]PAV28056.1 DNA-binding response regulator [Virgibacillus profundi]PXY52360.1 DNA-binding response regulator [Virgibacillus profundi]
MRPIHILIVEDDFSIVEILRLYLEKEGYIVHYSLNAAGGLHKIEKDPPDIVLLDLHLPDTSGFDLARRYRRLSDGILIFITGERTKDTIMKGFELGCDDYITKPFDPPEVIARIKANLRRAGRNFSNTVEIGGLTINFSDKTVSKNGKTIDLFAKEKMLLFHLVKQPNQVFSVEQLFDLIWGFDSSANLKTVHVHLSTLRKKIEDNPKKPRYILTVRGFGYKFQSVLND